AVPSLPQGQPCHCGRTRPPRPARRPHAPRAVRGRRLPGLRLPRLSGPAGDHRDPPHRRRARRTRRAPRAHGRTARCGAAQGLFQPRRRRRTPRARWQHQPARTRARGRSIAPGPGIRRARMSSFRYRALAEDGRRVRGELDAADLVELEHRLRAQGLLLITGQPRRPGLLGATRIPRRELITFCFHLEQLLEAGVPPFESLAALRDAITEPRLQRTIAALLADIECGRPLPDAAARQPHASPPGAVSLLRAGETAGRLPLAVRDIGATLVQEEALATHARRISIYPAIVAAILLLAIVVALTQVVPEV